jgi:hypothetical protein
MKFASKSHEGCFCAYIHLFVRIMCEPAIFWALRSGSTSAFTAWVELSPLFLDFIGTPQKSERKESEFNIST